MDGFIYILTHKRMPGLVKIGLTTTTVEERVASINSATGVPGKFDVFYSVAVSDVQAIETNIHRRLGRYRYKSNKEFFELKPEVARQYVDGTIAKVMDDIDAYKEPARLQTLQPVADCAALGRMLRQRRREQRLRQGDLAKKAGVGARLVVDIERGKPTTQVGKVLRLLNVLGLGIGAFIEPEVENFPERERDELTVSAACA